MTNHERELVEALIKSLEDNQSCLWQDDMEDTLECIVTENWDDINEEGVTEDNFDMDIRGHVMHPSNIGKDNKFTGGNIWELVDQIKEAIAPAEAEAEANKVDIEKLEFLDGDLETEIYVDKATGKEYEVSISIERDWENMVEVTNPASYRDDGRVDGTEYYSYCEAINVIRVLLKNDDALLEAYPEYKEGELDDDALLEIGHKWYSIYEVNS